MNTASARSWVDQNVQSDAQFSAMPWSWSIGTPVTWRLRWPQMGWRLHEYPRISTRPRRIRHGRLQRCLHEFPSSIQSFRIDLLRKAITNVGSYNDYQGRLVAATFNKIEHLVLTAEFGREGSPVLYVHLRREDINDPGKGSPIGVKEVMDAFMSMKKSRPDEADVDPFNNALLRFWWDRQPNSNLDMPKGNTSQEQITAYLEVRKTLIERLRRLEIASALLENMSCFN